MVVGSLDDEIQQFIDARYIGSTEGTWRLFGNRIHDECPSVTRLALHLKGRMYFANPNCGERFYLRLLLTVVPGPISFEELYKVDNVEYKTYKEACIARGLLEDDNECDQCIKESAKMKTGYRLSKLFCLILTDCNPTQPDVLWGKHALQICYDLPHKLRMRFSIPNPTDAEVCDYGLFLLNEYLVGLGKKLSDYTQMPLLTRDWQKYVQNRLILEHEALAYEGLDVVADQKIAQLNVEQFHAYKEVTASILNNSGKIFFLNGPAGTGKIFVYNTIADSLRSQGHIVIMVTSSGVASLLLTGGRTTHSTFKIPLNVLNDIVCDIGKKSFKEELFKRAKHIVWDEIPMQHRYCVEAVDRSLQDLLGNNKPFGGITVVLGGDFKQTLPVIPKETREEIVCASIRKSHLWEEIEVLTLRNLQPRDGLCNGTRLMVEQLGVRVIEARILTGSHINDRVFIPRITLEPTDSETPFTMSRRQFPVRLAFAMTINKSQGQSVKIVGIDLQNPVFSHGQLYVALSRCTSLRRITVLLPSEEDETATNVVYPEVLL
ncbi:hypothetical protein AQUCO_00500412v1 [Aquilegia coerulea]|uniref:ATP-dependent DNA helicase n=1 Tax=Aquilegia coerulea TaxID=218851 RepID=A0A2G5ERT8_AQUCA|nr:hypothetical protein AQUCO_00500412v1 [Aquilegia coerulea]